VMCINIDKDDMFLLVTVGESIASKNQD